MKKCCGVLRIAVGITMLALLLVSSANAANLTVCPGGCEYSSIQAAINDASAGDTILVQSGTYYENVYVNKQLILRGIGNPVVDAGGSGSAITLAANEITLEGFTATGGGYYPDAGIKVISSSNTLIGNNASNNAKEYYGDNGDGISLSYSSNNMLIDNNASDNWNGISLSFSSNNTLIGNAVSENEQGISLSFSSHNTLSNNIASNNSYIGIHLPDSGNNKLIGNNASYNNGDGILLSLSNNILINNNASNNNGDGIYLADSNNTLIGNNASNDRNGISLAGSNNTLIGNNVSNNSYKGISLGGPNNTVIGNMMTGNLYNFNLGGDTDSDFNNFIDTSNLVEGRPIYYIIKASDTIYDSSSNAGTLYCISCVNVTVKNLNLNKNLYGIYFWNTSQSRIQNVNASNNYDSGIWLGNSNNNTLSGNNASSNGNEYDSSAGIFLSSSSNNTLSGNNASNNNYYGILMASSGNNTLIGNNASKNKNGILLSSSSNNTLIGTNASNNSYSGILLSSSGRSVLINNIMKGNNHNFGLDGSSDSDFSNQIDKTNLVDEIPVYYIQDATDIVYDSYTNTGTFYCISCLNVTIKNLDLKSNGNGIFFWNTSQSRIQNVTASNNTIGIYLSFSSNNTLTGNKISNNGAGTFLKSSSNNTLNGNKASNNQGTGISLDLSSNNTLNGNNVSNNQGTGISLDLSSNNMLSVNNASNNGNEYGYGYSGIKLYYSNNNTLNGNKAFNHFYHGISLFSSSNNKLNGNNVSNNLGGGISLESSNNNILTGNKASNNFCGVHLGGSKNNTLIGNKASNNGEGIGMSFSSNNNTLIGNKASNNYYGILLGRSIKNKLRRNNASNNSYGIFLDSSSKNILIGNYASKNNFGIHLGSSSKNNTIYNNIFNNIKNVEFHKLKINAWNTTRQSGTNIIGGTNLGGNFWGYPNGTGFSQTCPDVNGDGICDKMYILDENNIDYLPISMNFTKDKIPPKSVSNLKNISYASSYINWTWKDPEVSDFDTVQIYIDRIYKTSVLKGIQYYKANNLNANRSYTISTRTVDKNGNVSLSWKNKTAWTKPESTYSHDGTISGYIINDLNDNGMQENGLSNWKIELKGLEIDTNGIKKEAVTNETGYYEFVNLPAGKYLVSEKFNKDYTPTSSPVKIINLIHGQDSRNNNFTNRLTVSSNEDIKTLYKGENALDHIAKLVNMGPRVPGGDAEKKAAEYVSDKMVSYGLDVTTQEFPVHYFEDKGSTLSVLNGLTLNPKTLLYSPSGEITAQIADCGLGHTENFTTCGASGKIVLLKRDELPFRQKVQNAANASALAVIIYNNLQGNFNATLTSVTDIPAVGVSDTEGKYLARLLKREAVTVKLRVDTVIEKRMSHNVIGTMKGKDPEKGIVYLGGHFDSVLEGPGANDDASGIGALLEAARLLSTDKYRTEATLKFLAFGSEETTGLDGSYNYIEENHEEVSTKGIGMINLDMIGVGGTRLIGNIGLSGSNLTDYTRKKASAMNLSWKPFTAGPNSDHTYFEVAGVPVVRILQNEDPWYHTPNDTTDKINRVKLEENGELATATLYGWAMNPRQTKTGMLAKGSLKKANVYHDTLYSEN